MKSLRTLLLGGAIAAAALLSAAPAFALGGCGCDDSYLLGLPG
jgi:hypothetical protein